MAAADEYGKEQTGAPTAKCRRPEPGGNMETPPRKKTRRDHEGDEGARPADDGRAGHPNYDAGGGKSLAELCNELWFATILTERGGIATAAGRAVSESSAVPLL